MPEIIRIAKDNIKEQDEYSGRWDDVAFGRFLTHI
jgi:hypothetical protein